MPKEVTRHVKESVQKLLWGKAAGRCEFAGCNMPLWKSPVTQEQVNIAEKAHIWAFGAGGARGNEGIPEEELNDIRNLMLVCHGCHKTIDKEKDGGYYTASLLNTWKAEHEKRIERVTEISLSRSSHVLHYGANIGKHGAPLDYASIATAMFPARYPAEDHPISLGVVDAASRDSDPDFWFTETVNLRRKFDERVRPLVTNGTIKHISVFGLAPQPLLAYLGSLVTDITEVDVYQRFREPPGWKWFDSAKPTSFETLQPEDLSGVPALIISVTATVTPDRVKAILGEHVSIWEMKADSISHDTVRCRATLSAFRQEARRAMDRIKALHGQQALLHIFPAAPNSVAIELGRIRQPKADMPWRLYDQVAARGGFIHALDLSIQSEITQ